MGKWIVGSALVVIVVLVVYNLIRNRKQGKNSCGCGCSGCASSGMCHPQSKGEKEKHS